MKQLRLLAILLMSFSLSYDDVFDGIPSQFSGLNFFIGGAAQSHGGDFGYGDYKMQGALMPMLRVEGAYQKESGMWVNGAVLTFNTGLMDSVLFESGPEKLEVTYPFAVGLSLRRGFLFNPSTVFAAHVGIGTEWVKYTENSVTYEDSSLYLNSGVTLVLGVLMKWGIEMGLDLHANQNVETKVSGDEIVKPSQFSWLGKFGIVYHPES